MCRPKLQILLYRLQKQHLSTDKLAVLEPFVAAARGFVNQQRAVGPGRVRELSLVQLPLVTIAMAKQTLTSTCKRTQAPTKRNLETRTHAVTFFGGV